MGGADNLTNLQGLRKFNQFLPDEGNGVICLDPEGIQHVQLQILVEETK